MGSAGQVRYWRRDSARLARSDRGRNRGTYRKSEITRDEVISIMSGGEDLKSLEAEIGRLLASIGNLPADRVSRA